MELPDVNVLVYAHRADVPQHPDGRAWLEDTIARGAPFGVSKLTLSAVVRIATNRRAFATPSTLDEVFSFCEALIEQPNCQQIEPGERHWGIFQRICEDANITGSMVSDAWYAALAIEHGCEWITMDRDFARFPGLKWRRLPSA
jgi:toxin-antitoxin system PIN domain toxin